jgi:type I restriction enzyme S subunit
LFTETFGEAMESLQKGASYPAVTDSEVRAQKISFPLVSEQKRIVSILDNAFDAIATAKANTEKNLQNARALIQPAFMAVLDSLDHSQWQPSTVATVAMAKKGAIRTGPFGSQLLHSEFVDDGIPVLGIDNVVQNRFAWGERRHITRHKFNELSRYQVRPGDILITIMGTCGRCAIVPNDIPTAINSKHICCITLDRQKCLPEFLHAYFLYHSDATSFLSKRAKGSIMAGLNMGIIKELPIQLPPIEQQLTVINRIATIEQELQNLAFNYRRKLAALDELKKSLLHEAFTGAL